MHLDELLIERIAADYFSKAVEEDKNTVLTRVPLVEDDMTHDICIKYLKAGFIRGFTYAMSLRNEAGTDTE